MLQSVTTIFLMNLIFKDLCLGHNPVNESLNGWIKEELFIDFDLKYSKNVLNLIKLYIDYYNYEKPSYALNYKTPIQYKIESGV